MGAPQGVGHVCKLLKQQQPCSPALGAIAGGCAVLKIGARRPEGIKAPLPQDFTRAGGVVGAIAKE